MREEREVLRGFTGHGNVAGLGPDRARRVCWSKGEGFKQSDFERENEEYMGFCVVLWCFWTF